MIKHFLRNKYLNFIGPWKDISNGVHILNGHYIAANDVKSEIFYELLKKINNHAELISANEAIELIQSNKATYLNSKYISFTFDDGFEECATKIAPVLNDFKIKGLFFIITNFHNSDKKYNKTLKTEKLSGSKKNPMTITQLKKLAEMGHILGSHTKDHIRLNESNLNLENQLLDSKKWLQTLTGKECEYFAWPYGKLNDISEDALSYALEKYKALFSSDKSNYYYSINKRIINRRHFEGAWPYQHLKYFLSQEKKEIYHP